MKGLFSPMDDGLQGLVSVNGRRRIKAGFVKDR